MAEGISRNHDTQLGQIAFPGGMVAVLNGKATQDFIHRLTYRMTLEERPATNEPKSYSVKERTISDTLARIVPLTTSENTVISNH
jgi:hypothetical protein